VAVFDSVRQLPITLLLWLINLICLVLTVVVCSLLEFNLQRKFLQLNLTDSLQITTFSGNSL